MKITELEIISYQSKLKAVFSVSIFGLAKLNGCQIIERDGILSVELPHSPAQGIRPVEVHPLIKSRIKKAALAAYWNKKLENK